MNRRLIFIASVVLLATATFVLGWSSLFTVSSIEVKGTDQKINSGISIGQKLARVEPRAVAAKFEALDWVARADVARNWINGKVEITLTERTPIAIFNNRVIDSNGESFVLRGPAPSTLVQVQAADLSNAVKAVTFFISLPTELKSGLRVIKVRSTGAFVLEIERVGKTVEVRWGTDTEKELKISVYKAVIALPENQLIRRVDVSAPRAPIVK